MSTYTVGGLTFERKDDHRVVVSFLGPRTEETLSHVAALYYRQAIYTQSQFRGEWRWCANPQCINAIYLPQKHLKRGRCTCSHACSGRVHTLTALRAKNRQASCCHRWDVESPHGPTSVALCWKCGAERELPNSISYSVWDSRAHEGAS